jgi:hypothetical protein
MPKSSALTAMDYLNHARQVNAAAWRTFDVRDGKVTGLSAKVSIGLSLQALELAGKGILLGLGETRGNIRSKYSDHNVRRLLEEAQKKLQSKLGSEDLLANFLNHKLEIDGRRYANTVGHYLQLHYCKGASAFPRSYFYPDHRTFACPKPIQATYFVAEKVINIAEQVDARLRNAQL